jgi:hypothetical protein
MVPEKCGASVPTENTVQDHLKSIFANTSWHNRRRLLSRALGVPGEA